MVGLGPQKEHADAGSSTMFSLLSDEELVDKVLRLGRETDFERHLLPHERLHLQAIKAELLIRLRNKKRQR